VLIMLTAASPTGRRLQLTSAPGRSHLSYV